MTDPVRPENALSHEDSLRNSGVSLEAILCTEELPGSYGRCQGLHSQSRKLAQLEAHTAWWNR